MAADLRVRGVVALAFTAMLAATAVSADPTLPPPGTYRLDPTHTFVEFRARHLVVGAIRGRFARTTGTVVVTSDPADCSVEVSIETATLSTGDGLRDIDVKGPELLAAARFPEITYRGKGIRKSPRGWVVNGTLSIRGVEKPVPVEFSFVGTAPRRPGWPPRIAFRASAAVQRSAFGMIRDLRDHSGLGADAADVWIEIDTEALLQIPELSARGDAR